MDKPMPILVVSSEIRNRQALRDILNREGWKTIGASTVSECKEVFHDHNIDVVFCERGLMDGSYRDLLAMTRSRGRSVWLVVTSRLADWDEYLEALRDGAFDLIASPIQTTDIVRVINQAQRESQKIGTPAPCDAQTACEGRPLGPPFTMSRNRSIERYPSMTSPIGPSPRTLRTEDWHFCQWSRPKEEW